MRPVRRYCCCGTLLARDNAAGLCSACQRLRGLCELPKAHGHAFANDAASCERSLATAYAGLLGRTQIAGDDPCDELGRQDLTAPYVLAAEARCWLRLRPSKAIGMLEDTLRMWPRDRARGHGVHRARLALACAAADEPDRAAAEGLKALDVARATRSDVTLRELKRLDRQLATSDVPAAADFREALAAV